jgi:hypothetical protein
MGFEGSFLPSVCAWQVRKHLTAAGPCMRGITPNSDVFKQSWEGEFAIPCDTVDFSFFRKKPVKRFECFLLNSYEIGTKAQQVHALDSLSLHLHNWIFGSVIQEVPIP